jgi:hypothetical protein
MIFCMFAALFANLDVQRTLHQGRRQREEVKNGSPLMSYSAAFFIGIRFDLKYR